jgi:hypothetical protein
MGRFFRVTGSRGGRCSGIDWAGSLHIVRLEDVAQYEAAGSVVVWDPPSLKPDDYDDLVLAKERLTE